MIDGDEEDEDEDAPSPDTAEGPHASQCLQHRQSTYLVSALPGTWNNNQTLAGPFLRLFALLFSSSLLHFLWPEPHRVLPVILRWHAMIGKFSLVGPSTSRSDYTFCCLHPPPQISVSYDFRVLPASFQLKFFLSRPRSSSRSGQDRSRSRQIKINPGQIA
jgi:hypothetical protein